MMACWPHNLPIMCVTVLVCLCSAHDNIERTFDGPEMALNGTGLRRDATRRTHSPNRASPHWLTGQLKTHPPSPQAAKFRQAEELTRPVWKLRLLGDPHATPGGAWQLATLSKYQATVQRPCVSSLALCGLFKGGTSDDGREREAAEAGLVLSLLVRGKKGICRKTHQQQEGRLQRSGPPSGDDDSTVETDRQKKPPRKVGGD